MTKIKICGIKTIPDALASIDAGADLLGFNFYPASPRYLTPHACREITSIVRKDFPQVTLVGVFVNAPVAEIRSILETAQLHLAQLHGDETPEMLANLQPHAFKAIRLQSDARTDFEADKRIPDAIRFFVSESAHASVPALLVDAAVKGVYGGSGVVADWSAAAQLARRIPLLLAGGLTPENVSAAIEQVKPWGVDVASGVEANPGVKDPAKMKKFVEQVHSKK
ncbi:MAG: phosphoribosylanthranilate isomerase [Anaerolineae bacterium]|nr:phosphoribosylanthranilate isomerase [Anaerolineae bacterium]